MNLGNIITPNEKGQIVIPKKIRDLLGINSNTYLSLALAGSSFYVQPIKDIVLNSDQEQSYTDLLKSTQGAWTQDNWNNIISKRKKVEKLASEKRKKSW